MIRLCGDSLDLGGFRLSSDACCYVAPVYLLYFSGLIDTDSVM